MQDITNGLHFHAEKLEDFLNSLTVEKKFFNISLERIMSWERVMVETIDDSIAAIAGLERKYATTRSTIIVKSRFQRSGVGKRCLQELLADAGKKYSAVWAVIQKDNIPSIRLHRNIGYVSLGERQDVHYMLFPLTTRGTLMLPLVRSAFPISRLVDKFRR